MEINNREISVTNKRRQVKWEKMFTLQKQFNFLIFEIEGFFQGIVCHVYIVVLIQEIYNKRYEI